MVLLLQLLRAAALLLNELQSRFDKKSRIFIQCDVTQ
jgi:hypothetical protein